MLQTFKKVNEIQLSTISPSINKSEYWLLFYIVMLLYRCAVSACMFAMHLHTTRNGLSVADVILLLMLLLLL